MTISSKAIKGSTGIMAAILLVGTFACVISQTLFTTALPTLMKAFNINASTVQWLTTAYMMANGILIPVSGFLGRRFNTKWLFIASMSIFLLGTVIGYIAPNFITLLIGRIIQAGGTGILMPLLQTVMFSIFPAEKRGEALGLVGIVIGFAPAIGPTVSGWIIDSLSWRDLMGLEIPLVIIVIIAAILFLHPILPTKKQKLDIFSIILSTIGCGSLLYSFSSVGSYGWESMNVSIPLFIGIIFVIAFIFYDLKIKNPLLELRVFRLSKFTLGTILGTIVMISMIGVETILPLYLQNIHGFSAFDSGLALLPGALFMSLLSPITGKAYDKFGAKRLGILGISILITGTVPFLFLTADTPIIYVIGFYSLRMLGIAMVLMTVETFGMSDLPSNLVSDETASFNTIRQIGGSIGSAIIISILSNLTANNQPDKHLMTTNPLLYQTKMLSANMHGYHGAFLFSLVFCLIALILTFFLTSKKNKKGEK